MSIRKTLPARLLPVLLILCCLADAAPPARAAAARRGAGRGESGPRRAKRVLVVSLDGLDARYLARRDEYRLKIPTLRRLLAGGAWASGVVSVYPSVTYPSHTTMVTGVLPARHRIFGNEVFDPAAPRSRDGHWFARDIRADTLWDAAARRGLRTGMVSWPVAGGAGDWNVPEFWTPDGTQRDTLAQMTRHARPAGLVEEVAARDPALFARVTADEQDDMRTRFAEYVIAEKRPEVMLVHLFDLDHFQHDFGPFTPEAFAMLEKTDGYLARLLAAGERAGTLAETAVFVMSDHGFRAYTKEIHPAVILERAGLLKLRRGQDGPGGVRAVVEQWRAFPYGTGGSCAVMLRDPTDRGAYNRARAALKDYVGVEGGGLLEAGGGLLRVVTRREIKRLGGNTRAAFVIEAAEGYAIGANLTGGAVTINSTRGAHGYLPAGPGYRASFVAWGAGVTRRGSLGEVRMTDIGPTLARAAGVRLRDADGAPLRLR